MMNVIVGSSECSSGCESGWTLYLEHSTRNSLSDNGCKKVSSCSKSKMVDFKEQDYHRNSLLDEGEEVEEEDLSMVSDASSGPPHFDHDNEEDEEDEDVCRNYTVRSKKRSKLSQTHCCHEANDFALDDTASSHVFHSKKSDSINVENEGTTLERLIDYSSQGYSATHFQGRSSTTHKRFDYIHSLYSTHRFQPQNQWYDNYNELGSSAP